MLKQLKALKGKTKFMLVDICMSWIRNCLEEGLRMSVKATSEDQQPCRRVASSTAQRDQWLPSKYLEISGCVNERSRPQRRRCSASSSWSRPTARPGAVCSKCVKNFEHCGGLRKPQHCRLPQRYRVKHPHVGSCTLCGFQMSTRNRMYFSCSKFYRCLPIAWRWLNWQNV